MDNVTIFIGATFFQTALAAYSIDNSQERKNPLKSGAKTTDEKVAKIIEQENKDKLVGGAIAGAIIGVSLITLRTALYGSAMVISKIAGAVFGKNS